MLKWKLHFLHFKGVAISRPGRQMWYETAKIMLQKWSDTLFLCKFWYLIQFRVKYTRVPLHIGEKVFPLASRLPPLNVKNAIFISKEDYLRFLSRVIGDENHFPTNKTLVWGAYIDQLMMPDNFAFMCWKNFISEKWPKMAFFGIFPISYRDQSTTSHSDLSLMIFTSHSDPVIPKNTIFGHFLLIIFFQPIKAKLSGIKSWSL